MYLNRESSKKRKKNKESSSKIVNCTKCYPSSVQAGGMIGTRKMSHHGTATNQQFCTKVFAIQNILSEAQENVMPGKLSKQLDAQSNYS
jgi:hypothetical protein